VAREFALLVGIAVIISWPIAYFGMKEWLEGFAFRIDVGWWVFAAAGGIALGVAMLTVSYQALRAAASDPVKSLRYE
jgi:putative ABC transport system permease protein